MKKYVILSLALLISCPAFAGSVPVELGEYGDWTAYSYKEGKIWSVIWLRRPKRRRKL